VVRVLDAWGADVVLVETVGVGQDELEIVRVAHTTLVVMTPGMGDDVQAIKAGILECADVFAVNKADREGADATVRDLELMIALGGETVFGGSHSLGHGRARLDIADATARHAFGKWIPPIQKCVATTNQGVVDLLGKLDQHRGWLETAAGKARQLERLRLELTGMLRDVLAREVLRSLSDEVAALSDQVSRRETDPYTACERLIERFRAGFTR